MKAVTIGDATLYLADCRSALPALPDGSVDLLWTDPPYGHKNHDGDLNSRLNEHRNIESKPIANDGADEMREVVDFALREATRILKPDYCCCCCCCGGGGPYPTFAWVADRMDSKGLQFFHAVVWDKSNPGLGWRYRRQYEMVMVSHLKGGKLAWNDEEKAVPNIFKMMPPRERKHPNEKPLPLVQQFIRKHTVPGDVVLDPFMGSGTTGVAALNLGRKFIGIELDPEYFEVACKRLEDASRSMSLLNLCKQPTRPEQGTLTGMLHA